MDAKLSVTTRCNAACATCPVWQYAGEDMTVANFQLLWEKLMASSLISRVLLNNTGDLYNHPESRRILQYVERHRFKPVIMTTNAGEMDYVPKIDVLIVSFNGGTKETYEATTGLSFEEVKANIRSHYTELRNIPVLEMHCLMWEGNAGTEDALLETWRDFPGRIRLSYKYDNQMKDDKTLPPYRANHRVPCDYLGMFSIMPDGHVVSCAHDFKKETNFGNVFDADLETVVMHPARLMKIREHKNGVFSGLCANCNYNTPLGDRIRYIK